MTNTSLTTGCLVNLSTSKSVHDVVRTNNPFYNPAKTCYNISMSKKPDFDGAVKKVEEITNTVEIIMRNRLIIAIFLIVDGITFLQNPDETLPGMAKNIILIVLLATFSVFITNLAAKNKDVKTIIISATILVLGGVFYFFPDLIAAYLQLALSLFIIYDGAKNIVQTMHLDSLFEHAHQIANKFTQQIAKKYHKLTRRKVSNTEAKKRREKFREVDDSLDNELEGQKNKMLAPLNNIIGKTSKFSKLYIVVNAVTIILGIVLLVFPDVSLSVWGLIFLYTGISNLAASIKTMNLRQKLKEKRFKEIIFDAKAEADIKSEKASKERTENE